MPYLLKTESDVYSFADLQRDHTTVWDGVSNPRAVKNLREMQAGDELVIYHTGDERAVIGTAKVLAVDATDRKAPKVTIQVGKKLAISRTLAQIKANKLFADSPLVTIGRLGVVQLTPAQHEWLLG